MHFSQRETRLAESRLNLLQWGLVVAFVLLLSGFWRLQILLPDYYSRLADRNHIKSLPIPAPRGRILDRDGRVLVDNTPSFSIIAQAEGYDTIQEHLPALAEGLEIEQEELTRRAETRRQRQPYGPIVLVEEASRAQIAYVASHRSEFPELDLMSTQKRVYQPDGLAAHLLGYLGEVSESDLDLPQFALLEPGERVGKSGIERQYDTLLRGEDGLRRVVVDSYGREVTVLDSKPPVPGRPLRLTLDYDLQLVAEQAFEAEAGALVALDARTGEVLAMVSRPGYDPNLFSTGIATSDWTKLTTDPRLPLLNRATQAQLAPGSVYKLMLATAALEAGTLDETTTYTCPGGAVFYGRYFRCWQSKGHGRVSLHRAIAQSCDVFFYNVGKNLGVELMAEYSQQFGLGRKTGIDLPNEESGTMPSPEWKEKLFRQKWYPGETISLAIGQGALTTTPVQLAYSYGGITSDGHFARPHLVAWDELSEAGRPVQQPTVAQVALRETTVQAVTDALYGVVNEGGTGGRARIVGLDVGGKTGSAQVASIQTARSAAGTDLDLRDNGWFVGLAPRRNPEIVVAVLYQGGEHGSLAAPLAKAVIQSYFDKKKGSPVLPRFAQNKEEQQQVTTRPEVLPAAAAEGRL